MGLGIGGFVYSQLTRFFLEKSGTGGSLRWLSLTTLVGSTVVSLGIHKRHYEQPRQHNKEEEEEEAVDVSVPSVRWSRYLEDEDGMVPGFGCASDAEYDAYPHAAPVMQNKADVIESKGTGENAAQTHIQNTTSEQLKGYYKPSAEIKELDAEARASAKRPGWPSPAKPKAARTSKHVHFAPAVYRKAALDKLEGLARNDFPLDRRRRVSRHSHTPPHRRFNQARPQQPVEALYDSAALDLAAMPSDQDPKTATSDMSRYASIVRNWRMCLFLLGAGVGQVGWYLLLLFSTSISVAVGLDVHNAAMVLGTANAASAVGRFAAGYAADTVGPANALLMFSFLATSSSAILFIPTLNFRLLVTYACLCGASIGAADPLATMAAITQFGTPRAIATISMMHGSIGVLVAILAPNAQVVIERIGNGGTNYAPFHVYVLVVFAVSTFLLLVYRLCISGKFFARA
ncbi:hypothetical protein GGI23_004384 [Coemansia sp. RSA 2559]|nr:hypothetical protein GGI23_004384 [Coemansia sp. RSA 2559]